MIYVSLTNMAPAIAMALATAMEMALSMDMALALVMEMVLAMASAIRTLIKLAAIIAWLLFLRVIGRRPCWPFD